MTTHAPDPIPLFAGDSAGGERGAWLLAQLAVLAAVSAYAGVGVAGLAVGLGYAGVLLGLLDRALRRSGRDRPGPADRVTLARAVLVGGVIAVVVDRLVDAGAGPRSTGVLVVLAGVALALDGLDGRVARRTGTASAVGASFDQEVDAVLILTLSLAVVPDLGGWVLAIGVMRYAFGAAGRLLPWLRAPLPVRYSAKVVAVQQGVTLVVAASGLLADAVAALAVAVALAALTWSFGHDVRALRLRHVAVTASPPPQRRPPG